MASWHGKLETVRTLVELGVEKEAKDVVVRNLIMMIMMMMALSMVETMMMMMILVDKNDCR